jgi:DNA-binding NarL/FixJ family response regulator
MRVILAEDDVRLREGIARILGDEGHDVVAQAGDCDDLLEKVRRHIPDLVVTDIRMPPTFTREPRAGHQAPLHDGPEQGLHGPDLRLSPSLN